MMLHDFDLAESVVAPELPWSLEKAQQANAAINTLVLGLWTAWLAVDTARVWLGRRAPQPSSPAVSEV